MSYTLNTSVAVLVTAYTYGPEELDAEGYPFRPITGVEPGVRIDVQRQCVDHNPALEAFIVHPENPVHDCGPNGVRLFADTIEELQAAAPPCGSCWAIWIETDEEAVG